MTWVNHIARYFPILDWGAKYNRKTFINDLLVAGIVTVMLIPQSLAYAMLAGLPPEVGLYASMAPLILYAIFGTSRALAVGPVAVASLMTAAAAATVAAQGTPEYLGATIALAMISVVNTSNRSPHLASDAGFDVKVVQATEIANKANQLSGMPMLSRVDRCNRLHVGCRTLTVEGQFHSLWLCPTPSDNVRTRRVGGASRAWDPRLASQWPQAHAAATLRA